MSAPDPTPLCCYCGHPVDPGADTWISHGTMAHSECAWGVNDEFFLALDVESKRDDVESKQ